jgi:hypothetical protein
MSVHLREHYGHSLPQLQFNALLDLCDRAMPGTEHKGEHCKFCGEVISLDEARDHLGNHMEILALFVLSKNDDLKEEVAPENSIQAKLSDSRSGTKYERSEKSSFSISVFGSPKTNVSFFTDALPIDEMDFASKFAAWSIEEDERNPINVSETDSSPQDSDTEESWYCSACQDGPIGPWQKFCVSCGHARCGSCRWETRKPKAFI